MSVEDPSPTVDWNALAGASTPAKTTDGILCVDIFNSADLKMANAGADRQSAEEETFAAYHEIVRTTVEAFSGKIWMSQGDASITTGFKDIDETVVAAETIQRRLYHFNRDPSNQINARLIVRIGLTDGNLPNTPRNRRSTLASSKLDEVGHLEKDCPLGRIRISKAAYEKLKFARDRFRPSANNDLKTKSKCSLVWTDRSMTSDDLKYRDRLAPPQYRAYPLIVDSAEAFQERKCGYDFSNFSEILSNSFIILGETRPQGQRGTAVTHPSSTSDAIGIIDVMAALQNGGRIMSGIDEWVDTEDFACQRNIIVIGSPAVNIYAYAVNTVTAVGFTDNPARPLRIRVLEHERTRYLPDAVEHTDTDKYYGLALIARNPLNPQYHMLWIAGVSGIATQAASRFVRDLITDPGSTLSRVTNPHKEPPNAVVVRPNWVKGYGPHENRGKWRAIEYSIEWAGRT